MSEVFLTAAPDIRETAQKIYERYYDYLGTIDMDTIVFVSQTGTLPKSAKVAELKPIRDPYMKQRLSEFGEDVHYCFYVWDELWQELLPEKQELHIFDALYSIPPGGNGKIRPRDVVEHGIICEFFGPYWRNQDIVPSLLDSEDPLPIPLPPDTEDMGSTVVFDPHETD